MSRIATPEADRYLPTLEHPTTSVNVCFESTPTETLEDDALELARRWDGLLSEPPQKRRSSVVFHFIEAVAGRTIAVALPGMVELRTREDPTLVLTQIMAGVLLETTSSPKFYETTIIGIRPQGEYESATAVLNALERPFEDGVINIRKVLGREKIDFLGMGHRRYVPKDENYYTVDFNPYIYDPRMLSLKLKSRRGAPITYERFQTTINADWSFFHSDAKQMLKAEFPIQAIGTR